MGALNGGEDSWLHNSTAPKGEPVFSSRHVTWKLRPAHEPVKNKWQEDTGRLGRRTANEVWNSKISEPFRLRPSGETKNHSHTSEIGIASSSNRRRIRDRPLSRADAISADFHPAASLTRNEPLSCKLHSSCRTLLTLPMLTREVRSRRGLSLDSCANQPVKSILSSVCGARWRRGHSHGSIGTESSHESSKTSFLALGHSSMFAAQRYCADASSHTKKMDMGFLPSRLLTQPLPTQNACT